jgi:hypothetical protein
VISMPDVFMENMAEVQVFFGKTYAERTQDGDAHRTLILLSRFYKYYIYGRVT